MRTRMLVFLTVVLVGLVPVLAAGVVGDELLRRNLSEQSLDQLRSVAAAQERAVQNVVEERAALLALIASRTLLRAETQAFQETGDPDAQVRLSNILLDTLASTSQLGALHVHALDGTVIGSTSQAAIGTLGDEEAFGIGLREIRVDLFRTSPPMNVLTTPLFLEGEIVGVLVVETDMGPFNEIAATVQGLGDTGETLIAVPAPGGARFITPTRFDPDAALRDAIPFANESVPVTVRAVTGQEGDIVDAIDYRGQRVFASLQVTEHGWAVVVKMDRDEVLAPLGALRVAAASVIGGAMILITVGSLVVSEAMSRPVRRVRRRADDLRVGEYEGPARITGRFAPDELRDLETAMDALAHRLQATMSTRERLLRIASHELNTPLTPMMLQMTMLRHAIDQGDRAAMDEAMQQMNESLARLRRVVHDVTQAFHLGLERVALHVTRFNLAEVVRECLADHGAVARDKQVRLIQETTQATTLSADRERVRGILDALVENAIQFQVGPGSVRVRIRNDGTYVRVDVSDEGIGFEPSEADMLFTPFHTTSVAENRAMSRTGLGLTVAKNLVDFHDGYIGASSLGIDRGATFWFTLPKKQPGG